MLRQANNYVKIDGILSEIDLTDDSFVKDGKTVEVIRGVIKVRVYSTISGENKVLEIPVHCFSPKLKKDGNPNPSYESLNKVRKEFISIASCGSEDKADKISISGAKIQMNEFVNKMGTISSYPRIAASFVSKQTGEIKHSATFQTELVVAEMTNEVDTDGVETGRIKVVGVVPGFGGRVDVVPFYAAGNVADAVSQYWQVNDTVSARGNLNFTSTTETEIVQEGFGDPVEKRKTTNVSELLITGGSETPAEGELAYDLSEIQAGLAQRKARLEDEKKKEVQRNTTPPSQEAVASAKLNLGF